MDTAPATRRIELELRKPALALYGGVRPTLVVAGIGHPSQWGRGTWQVPADEDVQLSVFLYVRGWRFGEASVVLRPADPARVVYRAPVLPFGRGRLWIGA